MRRLYPEENDAMSASACRDMMKRETRDTRFSREGSSIPSLCLGFMSLVQGQGQKGLRVMTA
jgi:hypothetical protein